MPSDVEKKTKKDETGKKREKQMMMVFEHCLHDQHDPEGYEGDQTDQIPVSKKIQRGEAKETDGRNECDRRNLSNILGALSQGSKEEPEDYSDTDQDRRYRPRQ